MKDKYFYYDILRHLFTLKYEIKDYTINGEYLEMRLTNKEYYKYYFLLKTKLKDKVKPLSNQKLLLNILNYCLYSVELKKNGYEIIYKEIASCFHPADKNSLTKEEYDLFYGIKAQKILKKNK